MKIFIRILIALATLATLPFISNAAIIYTDPAALTEPISRPIATPPPSFAQKEHNYHNYLKRYIVASADADGHDPIHTPSTSVIINRGTGRSTAFLPWYTGAGGWSDRPALDIRLAPVSGSCPSCATTVPTVPVRRWTTTTTVSGTVFDYRTQYPVVDTGASALIVGPIHIGGKGNIAALDPGNTDGYQFYPFDNRLILGKWVKLRVTVRGGNPVQSVVATPTVLVATYVRSGCTDWSNDLWVSPYPTKCPSDPGYTPYGDTIGYRASFGIGWGQYNPHIPLSAQFLRSVYNMNGVTLTNSNWYRGYIIGKLGIQFGLPQGDQCIWYKLGDNSQLSGDCARPAGCIQFYQSDNVTPTGTCQQGQILPDTGATGFAVAVGTPAPYPGSPNALPAGSRILLNMGRGDFTSSHLRSNVYTGPIADFGTYPVNRRPVWSLGTTSAIDPAVVQIDSSTYGSFVNTGKNFYDGFDMCYNPTDCGVGFRRRVTSLPWPGT